MRIVLDTNVFVSGSSSAASRDRFSTRGGTLVSGWSFPPTSSRSTSESARFLGAQYSGVDLEPFLGLLTVQAEIVEAPDLPEPVSSDPDDDKFLACAIAAGVAVIVSGDKDLLDRSGWRSVRVVRPRQFADEFLSEV